MFPLGFDPKTSYIVNHRSTDWDKGDLHLNTASRGGYEPTTVPTTLGREAFPLHMRRQEELFSYGYTVYSW